VALGERTYVDSSLGHSVLVEDPRFPLPGSSLAAGSLVAPMPGTVLRVGAAVGEQVKSGDVLVVLEAMKMEHGIKATADGTVSSFLVAPGQQVEAGAVLAVVSPAGSPQA
jgi:propionyl-CoA carboxylase alpha chain